MASFVPLCEDGCFVVCMVVVAVRCLVSLFVASRFYQEYRRMVLWLRVCTGVVMLSGLLCLAMVIGIVNNRYVVGFLSLYR